MPADEEKLRALCQEYGIDLVILFGSQAKGYAREESDYDVGVLKGEGLIEAEAFLDLAYQLSRALGMGNLDLVDLRRASPLLQHEAARSGKVLYQAQPGLFPLFRVLAFKRYQDARYDLYRLDPLYIERSLERLLK